MNHPGVSCLCPTYGRPSRYLNLLQETVESFVRQDYLGPKELVILNDYPKQTLECSVPGVRVINLMERIPSLGEKYNVIVGLARYDLLAPWEDDDISLPGRLTQGVSWLGSRGYWNPQRTWYLPVTGLTYSHDHGVCHNASIYRRRAFNAIGGYPRMSGAQDAWMDSQLREANGFSESLTDDPTDWQYLYCWGRSDIHLSSRSDMDTAYHEHGQRLIEPGHYIIEPRWYRDYVRMTHEMAVRYNDRSKQETYPIPQDVGVA